MENSPERERGSPQLMFSRAGKSTNNLYIAFQDKEKHKYVQSKVAEMLGLDKEEDTEQRPSNPIMSLLQDQQ